MERAKAAAASVVSSLAFYDYVSVVDFDSQTSTSGPLVRADTQGKCAAKAFINDIGADGGTDFAAGFRAAFDVLEDRDSGSSGCEKVILFLTDGVSDHPADDYVRERNPDAEVRIFSFSFGDGADTTSPKSIACANGGVWQHVDSDGDLIFAMGSYYNVFAQGLTEGSIRWSEPYESFSGLGPLATASKPVFDTEHTPPQFLGIAAVDIGMCSIFESWDGSEVGQLLLNRSSSCAQLNLGPCVAAAPSCVCRSGLTRPPVTPCADASSRPFACSWVARRRCAPASNASLSCPTAATAAGRSLSGSPRTRALSPRSRSLMPLKLALHRAAMATCVRTTAW